MKTNWQLICDSGSTKATWCAVAPGKKKTVRTQGISPYFLSAQEIRAALEKELTPKLGFPAEEVGEVHYYGTGLGDVRNRKLLKKVLAAVFPSAGVSVEHDLTGAARALCGKTRGVACILGTGSNSCYYNGSRVAANNPGLGFILGDEGSGAFLGKKVIQYYLYRTFDAELAGAFDAAYGTTREEILDKVYKQPFPNRYLASFAHFLSAHRGHFMIENIIEDGLNDFFFHHISKYAQSWQFPVHFTGSIAWVFRDVVRSLCKAYEFECGTILKAPIEGLVAYHQDGKAPR